MREILFRAKRKDNGEWAEGSYMPWYYSSRMGKTPAIFWNDDVLCKTYRTPVLPETVGQYTGLTDKNGTKIFEGDICISEETTSRIIWNENMHSWYCEVLESKCLLVDKKMLFPLWHWDNCEENGYRQLEIIGNIHDNPELLEGGAE